MMFGENVAKVKRGTVDRISELREFILHNILSIFDTREAGRASVLSKRWYQAWSSVPVLDFRIQHCEKEILYCVSLMFGFRVNVGEGQCILEIIDRTMLRYDTHKYRIRKLYLELPTSNEKIERLVDKWIRIAVQNQVEELFIRSLSVYSYVTPNYRLPEILFRAKSLKVLNCRNIVLPYYETMELISLEYLTLDTDTVDTDLLHRILSFCPLVEFVTSTDLEHKKSEQGSSKHLRELQISSATITDDIVSKLAYGLWTCVFRKFSIGFMLNAEMHYDLKELRIKEGLDLVKVTIDAPNLIEFWYNCEVETSLSLVRVLEHCNAQFIPLVRAYNIP
ncbi:putative F-box/FBD/LRR-repeat protein At4g00315 [Silene latifolia]|uniref:putative F-box/FBD/LRR-repeat protein At4g00315 n=1 Tax=Silene latifolia TaxID=37657 RepID=UPI003D76D1C2